MKPIDTNSSRNIIGSAGPGKDRAYRFPGLTYYFIIIFTVSAALLSGENLPVVCKIVGGDTAGGGEQVCEFLDLVTRSSPELKWIRTTVEGEEYRHRAVAADRFPFLSVGTSSSEGSFYSIRSGREAGTGTKTIIQSAGIGIYLSQELPSAGTVFLGAADTLSVTIPEEGDTAVLQAPEVSFSISQPFFMNGKFIDPDVYRAKYEGSAVRLALTKSAASEGSNSLYIEALDRLLSIETIGKNIEYTREAVNVLEEEIRVLQISLSQGKGTQTEIWEKELERDTKNEELLSLTYSLKENQLLLKAATGLSNKEVSPLLPIIEKLPDFTFDAETFLQKAETGSSKIMNAELERQAAVHERAGLGGRYSPVLSVSLSISPQYPQSAEPPATLSESFSGLGEEGSWTKLSGSIALNVPIYTGGKGRYERKSKDSAVEEAALNLEAEKNGLADRIELLFLRRELLEEQRLLYSGNFNLAKKKKADTERLFALNRATLLDIQRREMQILYWEAKLAENKKDMFLNSIELIAVSGDNIKTYFGPSVSAD